MEYHLDDYDPFDKKRAIRDEGGNPVVWIDNDDISEEEHDKLCEMVMRGLGMDSSNKFVVLKVVDGEEGWMDTYSPQVASVQEYDSPEHAATCNVGSHPAARERGKPYRVVVIPWEFWYAFDVHSNRVRGRDEFEAVPTEDPPISYYDPYDQD